VALEGNFECASAWQLLVGSAVGVAIVTQIAVEIEGDVFAWHFIAEDNGTGDALLNRRRNFVKILDVFLLVVASVPLMRLAVLAAFDDKD